MCQHTGMKLSVACPHCGELIWITHRIGKQVVYCGNNEFAGCELGFVVETKAEMVYSATVYTMNKAA